MNLIVCDIDGTLTINDEQVQHCLGQKFNKQEILKMMDPVRISKLLPRQEIVDRINEYAKDKLNIIVLITGRWNLLKEVTRSWLKHHDVDYNALGMRRHEDWEKTSVDVKLAIYNDFLKGTEYINNIVWIDDDQDILDAVGPRVERIKV